MTLGQVIGWASLDWSLTADDASYKRCPYGKGGEQLIEPPATSPLFKERPPMGPLGALAFPHGKEQVLATPLQTVVFFHGHALPQPFLGPAFRIRTAHFL
jgi:hypothetical protein